MADSKITDLADGGGVQSTDEFVIARAGVNYKIAGSALPIAKLYDYTVAGADKSSIDTNVDDGGNGAALLPTTYAILEIWTYFRTDEAVTLSDIAVIVNNDTGANYDRYDVAGSGTSAAYGKGLGSAQWDFFPPGASATANYFAAHRLTIPNYGGTVGFKAAELTSFASGGGTDRIDFDGLVWKSTSAISRIKFAPATAGKKLKVGSRVLIYARA